MNTLPRRLDFAMSETRNRVQLVALRIVHGSPARHMRCARIKPEATGTRPGGLCGGVRALSWLGTSMKLRSYLSVLVLAGVAPLIVLTVIVTDILVRHQRAAVDQGLAHTVDALAMVVENQIETSIKALETLATSQRLDTDDLPRFYEQAKRVRDLHQWTTIGLIDSAGKHRLNVARPLGASLPDLGDRHYFTQVAATERPYVSDPVTGRGAATRDIGVAVPVMREGRLRYVLFADVDPARFNTLFERENLSASAIVSIVGRDGVILARNRDHARYVGRSLSPAYLARLRQAPEGRFRGTSPDGIELDSAYSRLAVTGWTLDLGVPSETLNAPVRRIAWIGSIAGGCIVLTALGLAVIFGRRMARDIERLASTTSTLGHGEPAPVPVPLRVAELEEMRHFIVRADEMLRARERERADLLAREQAARADAETANRAKDEFLAMLGHELRNPLGAIASALGLLNAAGRTEQMAERARAVIGRQVQHLSRLVDDLLDVSRVITGKVLLTRRPLDLAGLVTSAVNGWQASGRLDRHAVSIEASPVWVDADETRMEQVLSNLVGNALKYTPAGGAIRIRAGADGAEAVLEVADTGAGIPAELLDKMFDLFVQGDRTLDRAEGGLGIGLTLVKLLVRMHGGTVAARSEGPGKGAVLTVRLPRIATPAVPSPAPPAEGERGHRRVLIVEDNADAREMLRVGLTLQGHEVHEAADGKTAVERAVELAPEVALIDVGLPGFDGYEVARRIRATEGGRSMFLVAVTGYGQAEDRRRAQDAGFDAHVTKPVLPEQLAELIAGTREPTRRR
jgi:signal transduction histidine kinase/CheY-like chemotaxis protein